ncbi:hypothetical protein MMC13_006433 [Lambiella insularis]|nr:hypothetical protein [Lambiella insularis]
MKYTILASFALLLPVLVSSASFDSHDRRSEDILSGQFDRIARSTNQILFLGADSPAHLSRRHNGQLFTGRAPSRRRVRSLVSDSTLEVPALTRRSVVQSPLLRKNAVDRQQRRREAVDGRAVQGQILLSGDVAAESSHKAIKRRLVSRSPKEKKPKESKEQKAIDGAKKTLEKDLAAEKKNQDKAAANAQKDIAKAESKQQKDTAKENKNQVKAEGKAEANAKKAQAELQKEEKDKGKGGKAGKAYAKAEGNAKKAEQGVEKTKAKGTDNIGKINAKENKDLAKTGAKLDKDEKKAHDDQFGSAGGRLAKSHPNAWQKFKAVMAKIGEGIEWAITGISLLIPGAEEAGLARLAAKGAEMIAEKAAKAGAKKGAKEGLKAGKGGKGDDAAVNAAKTESDAQVAAGKKNEQQGKNQFANSAAAAKAKQQKPKRDGGLEGRMVHARSGSWW